MPYGRMHAITNSGWIEVVSGSMFSGKTEELLRRLRRAEIAGQSVAAFTPAVDDRYGEWVENQQVRLEDVTEASVSGNVIRNAAADGIRVEGAEVRAATPAAPAAAAYMRIVNETGQDDRLVSASSGFAEMVQLHRTEADDDGVMRMIHVEQGLELPAGGTLHLMQGGAHVMLMGPSSPLSPDTDVSLTLTFEKAGDVSVTAPLTIGRAADHGD